MIMQVVFSGCFYEDINVVDEKGKLIISWGLVMVLVFVYCIVDVLGVDVVEVCC